jgi:SsrA-binding protein
MNKLTSDIKVVATNRKATHDYSIEDRFEAGIALLGTEIKSIRAGQANLREGYVQPRGGELLLVNVHISPYDPAGREGHDPLRPRKLLLHHKEIARILTRLSAR